MSEQTKQLSVKQFFETDSIKNHMAGILGDRANQFRTSVLGIVNSSPKLQSCEPASIYQCALVATTLDLPINANLGYAYIIPYGTKAQFQIGYKGFIQLAQRSGQFKKINAVPVYDTDTEESVKKRLTAFLPSTPEGKVIGYCAYFQLLNGYEHSLTMTNEDLQKHGKKYSKSYSGLWTNDFESMARKTVLKLLLQRFAPMSIEMQRAEITDQSVIKDAETLDVEYIDNTAQSVDEVNTDKERKRIIDFISNANTREELLMVIDAAEQYELMNEYDARIEAIDNKKTK